MINTLLLVLILCAVSYNIFLININKTKAFDADALNKTITEKNSELKDNITKRLETITKRTAEIEVTNKHSKEVIDNLKYEIVNFSKLLFNKKDRGAYGEAHLSQILHAVYGGNIDYYQEQYQISPGKIVDLAIFLPNDLLIPVDSKFPLENFIKIQEDSADNFSFRNFKQDLKARINETSSYIINGKTTEYAVMFIPSESVFSFIYSKTPDVIEYARIKNVLIVSPTTMSAVISNIKHTTEIIVQTEGSKEIRKEIIKLGTEFRRLEDRWLSLDKKIIEIITKKDDFGKTVNKINNRFNKIQKGK